MKKILVTMLFVTNLMLIIIDTMFSCSEFPYPNHVKKKLLGGALNYDRLEIFDLFYHKQ